jgi:hypothetical protein
MSDTHGRSPTRRANVLDERKRQQSAEGWTPEHDDLHDTGELAIAAACYCAAVSRAKLAARRSRGRGLASGSRRDRRNNLVRAAALLLAEIERLDRAAPERGREAWAVTSTSLPRSARPDRWVCVPARPQDGRSA